MNCPDDAGLLTIHELINKNLKRRIYVHTQHDYFVQCVSPKLVNQIRSKSEEIHQYRTQQMQLKQWGITMLYNKFFDEPTSQLYKLHEQLDKLVMQAYSFNSSDDILEKLLELNLELAEKEKQGESVIGPWAPV
ncbi:hypothetical protein [Nostoc sp.]|uniref:hypothetical protein n=1 Tax=Nostoc sp. TaxID=1180 RepID=UPI002FF99CAF